MQNDKDRKHTRIAVYLIGTRNNTILLGKRKNTNHMNGYWSLPAGHVKEFESCLHALQREIHEECGFLLKVDDIQLQGIMHQLSHPYDYINYIYHADLQSYEVVNTELDKCETLQFFPIDHLPDPITPYIQYIIKKTIEHDQIWTSEYGWDQTKS